jgi:hypothetical protein
MVVALSHSRFRSRSHERNGPISPSSLENPQLSLNEPIGFALVTAAGTALCHGTGKSGPRGFENPYHKTWDSHKEIDIQLRFRLIFGGGIKTNGKQPCFEIMGILLACVRSRERRFIEKAPGMLGKSFVHDLVHGIGFTFIGII